MRPNVSNFAAGIMSVLKEHVGRANFSPGKAGDILLH